MKEDERDIKIPEFMNEWRDYPDFDSVEHNDGVQKYYNSRKKEGKFNSKNKKKKEISKGKILAGIAGGILLATTGVCLNIGANQITNEVIEADVIPGNVRMTHDSMAGFSPVIVDPETNAVIDKMSIDEFVRIVINQAEQKGISANEVAIALDKMYGYHGTVEGASFLGKIGEELVAYSEKEVKTNQKGAR